METSFKKASFFEFMLYMFNSGRDFNHDHLATNCDDDFGITDINIAADSKIIRARHGLVKWFKGLFANLKDLSSIIWSKITHHETLQSKDIRHCAVDFDQIRMSGEQKSSLKVFATII
jgi:hypothetical protein